MDYKIINYKYKVYGENDSYIDLMSKSFKFPSKVDGYPIIVNKYYVARPDLISLAAYNTDKYGDIICKINGISNKELLIFLF